MPEKLISAADFAEALNVSKKWVDNRIASGEIKAYRLGKLRRIPESEVSRILDESAIRGGSE